MLRPALGADGVDWATDIPVAVAHLDVDSTAPVIRRQEHRWFLAVAFPAGWFFPWRRKLRGSSPYWAGHSLASHLFEQNRTHVLFRSVGAARWYCQWTDALCDGIRCWRQ